MNLLATNLNILKRAALLHNITSVDVHFSGSGDSGSIDYVLGKIGTKDTKLDRFSVEYWKNGNKEFDYETKSWTEPPDKMVSGTLKDLVTETFYDWVDKMNMDITNDHGGYAEMRWTLADGVEFSASQYAQVVSATREKDYTIAEIEALVSEGVTP